MKKLMMRLAMTVMAAMLFTGCGKGASALAGQWVPAEEVDTDGYPENMVLKADGTGVQAFRFTSGAGRIPVSESGQKRRYGRQDNCRRRGINKKGKTAGG